MKAFAVAVALLASLDAVAADQCLTRSIDQIRSDELRGQIIVSTLASVGKHETQVPAGAGVPRGELRGNEGSRIASVTKTYVAPTVLRLWEDGKLDIEASITKFLPNGWMTQRAQS